MKKNRRIPTVLALLALCAPLGAQNIKQTVEVTNDYLTRFADFQKISPAMGVPDSLYRFDYDFDYSVFETPYKGSYEFSPYRIEVTPEARLRDDRLLYVRAGLGASFHPQLEYAVRLLDNGKHKIGIVGDALGFAGKYRVRGREVKVPGHDLVSRALLNGQYLRPAALLSYSFGYNGILSGEDIAQPVFRAGFNSGFIAGSIKSRPGHAERFFYDVSASYRYSGDTFPESMKVRSDHVGVALAHADASFGPVLQEKYKILFDLAADVDMERELGVMFGGKVAGSVVAVKPHLDFMLGPVLLDAGLRIDFASGTEGRSTNLAPDVSARFTLRDYDMELYAGLSGGQFLYDHFQIKQINHFAPLTSGATAQVARKRIHLNAGVTGHWGSRLQYELEGGYEEWANMPVASLRKVVPVELHAAYLQGRGAWSSARLEVDGGFRYAFMRIGAPEGAYAPPAFTLDLRGRYNWEQRWFAGLFAEAASKRVAFGDEWESIPGYLNLGLTGEWRIDSLWSAWAEAGNLLGMAIERMPGYAEKSPYLTIGFSLKL